MVVPVDGSEISETAIDVGAVWSSSLNMRACVVWVAEPHIDVLGEDVDSAYPSRLANQMSTMLNQPVEFELLRGASPAKAVTEFAQRRGAGLIVASTHEFTGVSRLILGSVAAEIVRHAGCPVVLAKPPQLIEGS